MARIDRETLDQLAAELEDVRARLIQLREAGGRTHGDEPDPSDTDAPLTRDPEGRTPAA